MPYPIVLDSRFRIPSSASSSNFVIQLERAMGIKQCIFKKLNLKFAWLPLGASPNNTIKFRETGSTGTIRTATIAVPATFSGPDIATAVQTALNAAGTYTYTVSYAINTGYFTISAGSAFELLWATSNNWVYKVLGFNNADDSGYSTSHTSQNVAFCQGFDYVVVESVALLGEADNSSWAYYQNTTYANSNYRLNNSQPVFVLCPIQSGPLGANIWTEGDFSREIRYNGYANDRAPASKFLKEIDIQLREPWTNTIIDMRGVDWQLELEVE